MKKCTLLFLFVLLTIQSWGQVWIKTHLSERVSVDLPSTPEVQEMGNKKVYQIAEPDYIINVFIADMSLVPNFEVNSIGLNNFYNGLVKGRMDAADDSKLLEKNIVKLGNYEGPEIKYTKDFNGMDDILVTSRIVLVDKIFFTFDIWDVSKKRQNKLTNRFLKSIQLK